MIVITRTPFRISFFGGGTDYPAWINDNGGAVLATSIDKYCYLSCRYLPPFFERKHRIVYSRIELPHSVEEIEHPAVRACLIHLGINEGIEIVHNSDLPARTGLGSSSSFTVGLLHALYALKGRMVTHRWLAEEAIHLEQDVMRENVGCQDQILAAFGGLNLVTFQPGRFDVHPVPLLYDRQAELESRLMLFYTGISRFASEVAAHQIRSMPDRRAELTAMRRMVDQGLDILTGSGSIDDFGRLLHEGWILKRRLSDRISTDGIDEMYARARQAGAFGGKLLGAGGGGFFLLFAQPERQADIRAALSEFLHVPFRLSQGGTQIVFYTGS